MKEKVYRWIDENEGEVVKLLQELIRIPSVNPYFDEDKQYMQEGKAQAYLKEYLEDMGMDTELTYPDAGKLRNCIGWRGFTILVSLLSCILFLRG